MDTIVCCSMTLIGSIGESQVSTRLIPNGEEYIYLKLQSRSIYRVPSSCQETGFKTPMSTVTIFREILSQCQQVESELFNPPRAALEGLSDCVADEAAQNDVTSSAAPRQNSLDEPDWGHQSTSSWRGISTGLGR